MRVVRNRVILLILLLASLAFEEQAADGGAISGLVRDEAGRPLSGVQITLTASQSARPASQAVSGPSGEYRFTVLAAGEYTLSAALAEYTSPAPLTIRIASTEAPAVADFTLTRIASASTSTLEPAHSPMQFETAGIRGLIDPGGYSASSNSAASGLLRGIADIRRTDPSFSISAAKQWPCSLELELRRAATEHPDQEEANLRLGEFFVAHEQPAQAIPLLKRALEIDGRDDRASREIAIAWLQYGDFEDARVKLTSLVERHSEPETHQLLARADEGSGMFLQAAQEYRFANDEQHSEESFFGVGYELILAGSLSDGVAAFQAGVREYPRSIPLRVGAGAALFLLGKTSEGLNTLLDASDIDPNDPRPYSILAGTVAASTEVSHRVSDTFRRFVDRNPGNAEANYDYALVLLRTPTPAPPDRIEALLKRAIQLDPNLARAHLQLGELYAGRGDYQDAATEIEAAIRIDYSLAQAHYRLAKAYQHTGRSQQAARELEIFRLSREDPANAPSTRGIDVSQFISVMSDPNQKTAQETVCPASPN